MTQKEDNSFDREIRSVLEQGHEDVPEGIWDAVSGKLDKIEAEKKRRILVIRLRNIGIAAAAAAVVMAVLFTGLDFGKPEFTNDNELIAVVTEESVASGDDADASLETNVDALREEETDALLEKDVDALQEEESSSALKRFNEENLTAWAAPEKDVRGPKKDVTVRDNEDLEAPLKSADISEAKTNNSRDDSEAEIFDNDSHNDSEAEIVGNDSRNDSETEIVDSDSRNDSETEKHDIEDDWTYTEDMSSRIGGKVRTAMVISGTTAGNAGLKSRMSDAALAMRPMGVHSVEPNTLIENGESKFALPMSFGIGTKIIFTQKWSLGIGINYTLLSRTFSGTYVTETPMGGIELNKYDNIRNNQSYIGIPVDVYFSIVKKDFLDFYAYAGGTIEKCVSNRSYIKAIDITHKEKVKGMQFSVNAGLGVEFLLVDQLGIYIDPSLRYYFKGSQPKSIRTQQPLSFGCEIGLRVRL